MLMSRDELQQWAQARDTDTAIATAIMRMATDEETMQQLWETPTQDEIEEIMELAAVLADEDDSELQWGVEMMPLDGHAR